MVTGARPSAPRSDARPRITSRGSAAAAVAVPDVATVREVVAAVPDPELPVITIADLGILRAVSIDEDGHIEVVITPTYSGCPAMDAIRSDIERRLAANGWHDASVTVSLSPAWTTDWITATGRTALENAGIAPPLPLATAKPSASGSGGDDIGPSGTVARRLAAGKPSGPIPVALSVRCPQCGSADTHEIARFGSTACKALWTCRVCGEPFDHVKAI